MPPSSPAESGTSLIREAPVPLAWRRNALLFAATLASVFVTFLQLSAGEPRALAVVHAAQFTASLLAILLAHEFGHFTAARLHRVDASLPYFIPLPFLSPFGTMGAVIRMRSVIPTRRALLDIGAAGPLAGLCVAIPLYAWGAAHSTPVPLDGSGGLQLGDSLLLRVLDRLCGPALPVGMQLSLSPVAFAAWAGMFVTMINLLPVGQLDGGHVAYALFGVRQNRIAGWVHRSMLVFFFVSVASFVARDLRAGLGVWHLGVHIQNSLFWLTWFEVLGVLGVLTGPRGSTPRDQDLNLSTRVFGLIGLVVLVALFYDRSSPFIWIAWFAGLAMLLAMEIRWGVLRASSRLLEHPSTDAAPLGTGRAAIAILTLAFFALLFMPTPLAL